MAITSKVSSSSVDCVGKITCMQNVALLPSRTLSDSGILRTGGLRMLTIVCDLVRTTGPLPINCTANVFTLALLSSFARVVKCTHWGRLVADSSSAWG